MTKSTTKATPEPSSATVPVSSSDPSSDPLSKPDPKSKRKRASKALSGSTLPIWVPGRYFRAYAEFYCLNEKCAFYKKTGSMGHMSWSGGLMAAQRRIICTECGFNKVESYWEFPAMPAPPYPFITDMQSFTEEVLAAKARGDPAKEKTKCNAHVILDKDNPDETTLDDILDSIQRLIQKDHSGNSKGLKKYIAKVLLVRWSKS